jgi:hypothetical protein
MTKHEEDAWTRGYAAALASVNRMRDAPSHVRHAMIADGITLATLEASGVVDFDMSVIRSAFEERS